MAIAVRNVRLDPKRKSAAALSVQSDSRKRGERLAEQLPQRDHQSVEIGGDDQPRLAT
jgi:hypothetical protein